MEIEIEELMKYFIALGIVLLFVIGGALFKVIIFGRLKKLAEKTAWKVDDIIVKVLSTPIILWTLLIGLYIAMRTLNPPEEIASIVDKSLISVLIISITLVVARLIAEIIIMLGEKVETTTQVTGLTRNITTIAIYLIGFLILINTLGISITPLITTLGLGGLAVALALQDTLSNLFSGFHITLAKQMRVGDYVRLETGEEGYVEDITWRTTKIRMLPNNVVLVPNAKLAQIIITNYYLPEKEMAVLVQVGVHYSSDLKKVERITCEVGREVMKGVTGGVPKFEPFIRYHTFDSSSINFTVILRAKEFVDKYLVKHEFIKRLHERYNKENIVIPFPIIAMNYDQEKPKRSSKAK